RQLRLSEACQLFMTRARAALPNFDLRDNNAVIAVRICRMLDGLPLAVELVAAHVARLGLNDLAARINSSFVLSLAGTRGAPMRHQTLRASLDWSYELLSYSEQLLIRRLAVFAAGWSPEVAADVCADAELDAGSVDRLVASLFEKSLVTDTGVGQ